MHINPSLPTLSCARTAALTHSQLIAYYIHITRYTWELGTLNPVVRLGNKRSKRWSMIVDNGVVTQLNLEPEDASTGLSMLVGRSHSPLGALMQTYDII